MDWRHGALCRHEDPELFFPIGSTGAAARQIDRAKAVCRRCAVTEDSGVWGGLSEDERRSLKRRLARQRLRTLA